jgi:hypothetical protein
MLRWAIVIDISFTTERPEYFLTSPRVSKRVISAKIAPRTCNLDKTGGIINNTSGQSKSSF